MSENGGGRRGGSGPETSRAQRPAGISKAQRGPAGAAQPRVLESESLLLRIVKVLESTLPAEPSWQRVELRTVAGELRAKLGLSDVASVTDEAWEDAPEEAL